MKFYLFIISSIITHHAFCQEANSHNLIISNNNEVVSSKGIVVCASPIAAKAGTDILKKGGNAIDAAIAVMFALAVVYPEAGNIGGGGFLVYREHTGKVHTLDFREKAPASTKAGVYLDNNGNVLDSLSQEGIYSIGVPGTVDGLHCMFEEFSKLKDWKSLIKPAIKLAKKGYPISVAQASQLNVLSPVFRKHNSNPVPFVRDSIWMPGDPLVQVDLAKTLERIAQFGRNEFYTGHTAQAIVNTMQARGKSWITLEDLANYKSIWRQPIEFTYKDYQIFSMPPPSSGGLHLAQLCRMMQLSGLSGLQFHSSQHVQWFTELERRVYADRAMYLGDPDFYQVPVTPLLNDAYLKKRLASIDFLKATASSELIHKNELWPESKETTHISILDKMGNAVSLTTTINGAYGSFVVADGAGFLLNNEMDDFSIKAGTPNLYGLIGSEANAVHAHKRMLSSMTPTIVVKDGKVEYVLGTPGGSTIITSVFQVLMNLIEFKMNPLAAVQTKRFHHQLFPDCIFFEEGEWSEKTISELKQKQYQIRMCAPIGRVELIARKGDQYIGVTDHRGEGAAKSER